MTHTSTHPVLVTGATGRIGRQIISQLLNAGIPVRALTRHPSTAALPPTVEVVAGDFTAPDSIDAALQGISAAFLLWTAPPATAPSIINRLAAAAPRVVFLSSPHKTRHPFFQQPNPAARLHADLERLLILAGLKPTIIRPGIFSSNAKFWWAPAIRTGSTVRWPYPTAQTAPIDDRDVAAVAARTLYEPHHIGQDYVLTGPQSLTQAEQIQTIAQVIGRPIHFEEISPEEFRHQTAPTWPRPVVDMLLSAWSATLGHPAFLTTTVSDLTGSSPRTFRQWATDHAALFQQSPADQKT